jgi:hypothetical protein
MAISEVIKAGSLGHGTAVPGHYDLDIVIYSESKYGKLSRGEGGAGRDSRCQQHYTTKVWMETTS